MGYNFAKKYDKKNPRRDLIPDKAKIVNINFRSHAGVLNCAGGFLDLLFEYFPGSAKQLKKDYGLFKGARPGVFQNVSIEQLSSLLRDKMNGVVVLTHDEKADEVKERLNYQMVYGIREAKGLEFKRVIILDFFANLPSQLQKPWRNLLLNREESDFELKYPLVETHLKLVYTGITRCIEQLFFAETESSIAGNAAVRWLTTSMNQIDNLANVDSLATINNVNELESMTMTNDEFCVAGIDNAELAETSEIGLEQSLGYLQRAIHMFENAQSAELVAKARVHCNSVRLREKLIRIGSSKASRYATSPATTYSRNDNGRQTVEEEAAEMVEQLLRANLLMECTNLLRAATHVVSPYTQQKLEEYIISKIQ